MFGIDDLLSNILGAAKPVLEHFFPDPKVRLDFIMAMRQIDLTQMQGQMEINKIEAANPNVFVSGWRPYIGWVGGLALTWQFLLAPILAAGLSIFSPGVSLPIANSPELMVLVTALLGIGAMRSYDKAQGTA